MNKEKLLKLADHLENGKLGHKKFDYNFYNLNKEGSKFEPYSCGYAGCAIGECPIAFPNDWEFNKNNDPCLKNELCPSDSAEKFFDINYTEFVFLFIPGRELYMDNDEITYSPGSMATKKQIALHIRKFVANNGIYKRKPSKTFV